MIVRTLKAARRTPRRIVSQTWESTRLLLHADQVGFSLHVTTIYAGTETRMCYRNHYEAVYCIRGKGEVECLADGRRHALVAGTMYVLDRHDEHVLRATTELTLLCVFNPALHGSEVHDASGAYPALAAAVDG
jgi:L-ectoine synthase